MVIYTGLVVLLLAASLLLKGNEKQNKRFAIAAFLLLFIVIGLRDVNAFGSDASGAHGSYPVIYQRAGNSDWGSLSGRNGTNFNIGFEYLLKLIFGLTGGDYQALVTILSLFFIFSYTRFIYKYSPSPIQSILYFLGLLYYTFLFDSLKQATAMSVLLFAFDGVIEKKPFKFLLLALLASAFHYPAIIFLPAYWIAKMKVGRNYILLLVALLVLTYLLRDYLLNLMLEAYSDEDTDATMAGIRFLRNKVIIMIAIVVFSVAVRPPKPGDRVYTILLLFAGVSIIFQTFCGYNNIFERLADYYFHTSVVFIPFIFDNDADEEIRFLSSGSKRVNHIAVLLICSFAVWRFLSVVNNPGLYLPYRFFWQG